MQQPVKEYVLGGQAPSDTSPPGPHEVMPSGQVGSGSDIPPSGTGVGMPPSPTGVITHSSGSEVLPKQISHFSQVLTHSVCCVQRGQAVASPNLSCEQLVVNTTVRVLFWCWKAQQPKQSHPLGVTLPQFFTHFSDCSVGQLENFGS